MRASDRILVAAHGRNKVKGARRVAWLAWGHTNSSFPCENKQARAFDARPTAWDYFKKDNSER
jgi:hypothetical protein